MKSILCPKCGELLDMHREIQGESTAPKPGDASICLYCCCELIFGKDGELRLPTTEEQAELDKDPRMAKAKRVIQSHAVELRKETVH